MTLAPLLLSLALAQGLTTLAPGATGGGKVLWSAPFATAGCYATGQTAGSSSAIAITRATKGTVALTSDAGTLTECASGEFRVGYDGLLVEPSRTNVAKASNTISAANAFDVSWVAWPDETVVDVTTAAAATQGGTWHTITSEPGGGSNVGQAYQTVTTGSSTTFAASVWMKKPVGEDTTHAAIHVGCGAGTPSACTCSRSDGGSCTASTAAVNYCQALVADLSTTAIRLTAKVTCSGAITSSIIALIPGNYGSTVGITDFTGAQHEIGTYPTSHIVTTTTATARNVDQISATIPSIADKWCLAGTWMPENGQSWVSSSQDMWTMTNMQNASNFAYFNHLSTTIWIVILNGATQARYPSASTTGMTDGTSYRLVSCFKDGSAPALYRSGSLISSGSTGTGGMWTTPRTTVYLGGSSSSAYPFGGYLKNIKICSAKSAKECP
jgi:hypothetical protein